MPLYDYQCKQCHQIAEVRHGFGDVYQEACLHCGGTMARVFNAAGIVFKGSGFYITDSRKSNGESKGSSEGKSGGESKSGESKSGESKSGESKSGESKSGESKSGESKSGGETAPAATPAASTTAAAPAGESKKSDAA